jgi:hypothetical protein
MEQAQLQAWWFHRQGLDGSLEGKTPAEVLERSGWARSVGGVGPYLTLHARAGTSREAADAAASELEIHELPSARACTYVVPATHFALALRLAQYAGGADMRTAEKLGVTAAEIVRLCGAVIDALAKGPLDPKELREAVDGVVRNLGADGKKKGLTSTLPVAIGRLQAEGEIRRVPVSGRLDRQRYRYALWRPNPLAGYCLPEQETYTELARRYFCWIGPATLAEFQWFSGLGAKAAKAAVEPLGLVPLEAGSDRLLSPAYRDELKSFEFPKGPRYALVSSLDGIVLHRRDAGSLVAPDDRASVEALAGGITDLPSHAILDRGRIVGLWEYDTDAQAIAWISFGTPDKELRAAVERTEAFVRSRLGDARAFSLDSPRSRAPRIAALRKAAAG